MEKQEQINNQNKQDGDQKKSVSALAAAVLVLIVAMFVGGGVYWWQKSIAENERSRTQKEISELQKTVDDLKKELGLIEIEEEENLKTFTGKKVKISFKYPSEWGEVEEKTRSVAEGKPEDGSMINIGFSKNPYISFAGASKESQIGGIGGPCPIRGFFNGTEERGVLSCDKCEETECVDCKENLIDGQKAVSFIYVPSEHCSFSGLQKVIYLITPFDDSPDDFPGLVITINLITADDVLMHDLAQRATAGGSIGEEQREQLLFSYKKLINENKERILNNDFGNYLTEIQVGQYNNFIESIKFERASSGGKNIGDDE